MKYLNESATLPGQRWIAVEPEIRRSDDETLYIKMEE